jgi:two-component system cell cycle response regulator
VASVAADVFAMEADRRKADLRRAQELEDLAEAHGDPTVALRARLVRADAQIRSGGVVAGIRVVEGVAGQGSGAGGFVTARSHFLLSIAHEMLADPNEAARHACLSVEHLPDDVAPILRAQHLVTLALSLDDLCPGDGSRYHKEALDIAAATGNHGLAISVLNNMAWNELDLQNLEAAVAITGRMQDLSRRAGVAFRAADLETIALVEITRGHYHDAIDVLQPVAADPPGAVLTEAKSLPAALLVLARAQRLAMQYPDARETLNRCRALCAASNVRSIGLQALREQADLSAAEGQFQDAYLAYQDLYAQTLALHAAEQSERALQVREMFEHNEQRRDADRYRDMAIRDALTGLYNRRFVNEQIAALLDRFHSAAEPFSLAIVDVDHFKQVNDTLSHEMGDRVLQEIGGILCDSVADTGSVARIGGEEFVVVLPRLTAGQAGLMSEAVRRRIEDHAWQHLAVELSVTASVGYATVEPDHRSIGDLLRVADDNLYKAKREGRNRVVGPPA